MPCVGATGFALRAAPLAPAAQGCPQKLVFAARGRGSALCFRACDIEMSHVQILRRGDRIRTCDIQLPKLALYQAELRPARRDEGKKMVARDGIEPPTRGFSIRCSTN